MTKKDFFKKIDNFSAEINADIDTLEDVDSFQDACEIATFAYDIKQRIQSLKEILK